MRSKSIVRFEMAYLASTLVWAIELALGWDKRIAMMASNPAYGANPELMRLGEALLTAFSLFLLVLWLLLWYFTARRASEVAKWIVAALLGVGALNVPFTVRGYEMIGALGVSLSLLAFALNAVAVWMLFQPDANAWFRASDGESKAVEPDEPLG